MNRQQREEFVRKNGMTYQDKSNEIMRVFRDEIGLELFQRQNYTLAAMNVKTNTPYRMHPNLGGVNVGVSFKHDCKASIEVYFKDNFYQNGIANPTFDVISEYFGSAGITTTTKEDGDYLLFLMPINQIGTVEACRVLNQICLGLNEFSENTINA